MNTNAAWTDEELDKRRRLFNELAAVFWERDTTLPERPTERQAVEAARHFLEENPSLWQDAAQDAGVDAEELAWSIGELCPGPKR